MDNEWQKTDKFVPHPKLIKLMEKTKELIIKKTISILKIIGFLKLMKETTIKGMIINVKGKT